MSELKNRQAEIEREWRRMHRRELSENLIRPLLGFAVAGGCLFLIYHYSFPLFSIILSVAMAVGLPLAMWLNRRK